MDKAIKAIGDLMNPDRPRPKLKKINVSKEFREKVNRKILEKERKEPKSKDETLTYEQFYQCANVKQHSEFVNFLIDSITDKMKRESFYKNLLEVNSDLSVDTFKPYFELYSAERKSFQQDYTPDELTHLLSILTTTEPNADYTAYDATAGTGSMIISKWNDDRIQETPWSYAPHRYFYRADELADNAIPFLIHNLAIRGMNAIVVHGDTLTKQAKQVYFIQNSKDDYMAFSDINIMPHTEMCKEIFGISEWIEEEKTYIESTKVTWQMNVLPIHKKIIEVNQEPPKYETLIPWRNVPRLKDVAFVERAQKDKIYPKDSIVIQISATSGQFGQLKSNGSVDPKYAVITFHYYMGEQFSGFVNTMLNLIIPHWFHMRQEGLNIKLEDIEDIPLTTDLTKKLVPIKYGQQALF